MVLNPRHRSFSRATLPRVGWRAARLAHELAHAHRPRCPVCGTRLLRDDPVGLSGGRVAHAECTLVHWLAQGQSGAPRSDLARWIDHEVSPTVGRLAPYDEDDPAD